MRSDAVVSDIVNAHPEFDVIELDRRIAAFNNAYQHARQAHTKLFTKNVWGKFTALNEADKQSIEISKQVIRRIWHEGKDIQKILISYLLYDNVFFVTKLKLQILTGRIYLSTGCIEDALREFVDSIQNLGILQKQEAFGCESDVQFQQEVSFAMRILTQLMRDYKRDHTSEYFQLNALEYALIKKWPPSIFKLQIMYNYWFTAQADGILLINGITPADRDEFTETYQATIADLENALKSNPTDASLAISYARANILAYGFDYATHPRSIYWFKPTFALAPSRVVNPSNISKHVKFAIESSTKYIASGIKQLLKADPASLQENAEPVVDVVPLLNELRSSISGLTTFFISTRKGKKLPDDLDHDVILASLSLIDLSTDTHEISHCFNLNAIEPIVRKIGPLNYEPATFQAVREEIKETKTTYLESEKKRAAAKALAADENTKFILEWVEKEEKSSKAINARLQPKKPDKDKPSKAPEKTTGKMQHYFTRAQYFSRNRHHHQEAVEMYELAYEDAIKSSDLYSRLSALDGQLFVHGKSLAHKVKMARGTLTARIHGFKTMPKKRREDFVKLMQEIKTELKELNKLHALYKSMTHDPTVETNKEIHAGIITSKILIRELIEKIETDICETNDLFAMVNDKLQKRRAYFIHRKGIEAIQEIENQTFTLEEIDAIGLEIFREMGAAKSRKGKKALSKFTQEKNLFESLAKEFIATHADFALLADQYKTKENTDDLSSASLKKIFAEVEDVPGVQLLVGSNVAAFLTDKDSYKKLKAHDVDFVSSCKDERALLDLGFHHSIYRSGLYQRSVMDPRLRGDDKARQIDLTPIKDTSGAGLLADAKTRDFTICAVYLDKYGKIRDPLATGIDDIANRRLRMIGDPNVRLRDDPVRALRAIRYILAGYEPDQALIDALKSLATPATRHQQHLLAVARKHLSHLDRKQYISLLHDYSLLEKLLGIKCKTNVDLALWKLEKRFNLQMQTKTKHTLFFARTDDDYPKSSSQANENPKWIGYADKKGMKPERRLAIQALNL